MIFIHYVPGFYKGKELALPLFIPHLIFIQPLQHRQHRGGLPLRGGQIHIAVVPAFGLAGAGDISLKSGHKAEGFHRQRQRLRIGQAAGQQIKTGAAAHGTDVNHAVLVGAVSRVGGEEMLHGVGTAGGEIIPLVRLLHADVPCPDVAVLTAEVHAPFEPGVVNAKAGDTFHNIAAPFLLVVG